MGIIIEELLTETLIRNQETQSDCLCYDICLSAEFTLLSHIVIPASAVPLAGVPTGMQSAHAPCRALLQGKTPGRYLSGLNHPGKRSNRRLPVWFFHCSCYGIPNSANTGSPAPGNRSRHRIRLGGLPHRLSVFQDRFSCTSPLSKDLCDVTLERKDLQLSIMTFFSEYSFADGANQCAFLRPILSHFLNGGNMDALHCLFL